MMEQRTVSSKARRAVIVLSCWESLKGVDVWVFCHASFNTLPVNTAKASRVSSLIRIPATTKMALRHIMNRKNVYRLYTSLVTANEYNKC